MAWGYGDVIMWCYGRSGIMPMRVVSDEPDELVVWLAPGTMTLAAVPVDGRGLRERPLAERFTCECVFAVHEWQGDGTLRISRRDTAHSSWLFRNPDMSGTYLGWYGNLESPLRRTDLGVHALDHVLDLFVDFQGGVHWKDEDEFDAAISVGRFSDEQATAIRAEGDRVYTAMKNGDYPYDGSWLEWKPDPSWTVPALPDEFAALAGQPVYDLFAR